MPRSWSGHPCSSSVAGSTHPKSGRKPVHHRTVYVEAGASELLPVARGQRTWAHAVDSGGVTAYGPPGLVSKLDDWFIAPM